MIAWRDRYPQLQRLLPLLICAAILVWHSLQYDFVTDDAYVSFVYARNLAEHGALVFNPGSPPVEGYTNFLWTVILAVFLLAGLSPVLMSRVLGTGFGVATLVVAFLLVEHLAGRMRQGSKEPRKPGLGGPWPALAAALLSLSAGFACWSSGGLETQMFTFLVALALYGYARGESDEVHARPAPDASLSAASSPSSATSTPASPASPGKKWLRWTGIFCALAAMTRPEGVLVMALLAGHRLAGNLCYERRILPSRDELHALARFLLLWAPWYAWRWWYYGYPFPNTYYVKASGQAPPGYSDHLVTSGLYYVWQWAQQSGALHAAPLFLLGLWAIRARTRRLSLASLALGLTVVYLVYTVKVGGDFMGLHRFIMPLFVVVAVAVSLGLGWLTGLAPAGRIRWLVGALLCVTVLAGHGVRQIALTRESLRWGNWKSDHGIDTPAFLAVYTEDRATIGRHMRPCFTDDDFSIVGGVGAQPYEGRMKAIDVFGLVSERVAHEVPPTIPRPGHNKMAPDSLLLSYQPDFVFSCYSIHRDPRRPYLNCQPSFWLSRGYRVVTLFIPGLRQQGQQGQYYSFLERAGRNLACPGLVE